MIHHQFCIIENHHQIKESLSLEENTKKIKINNLVSVKKRVDFIHSDYFTGTTPIILEYRYLIIFKLWTVYLTNTSSIIKPILLASIFENLNENKPVIKKIKQNIYPKLLEPP